MAETGFSQPSARRSMLSLLSTSRQWLLLCCLPILLFLILPILVILPLAFTDGQILMFPPKGVSFGPFEALFADRQWTGSAWVSLKIALVATVLSCLVGTLAAAALDRSNLRAKGLIVTIILLPMLVPTIVLALGFYMFFLQFGLTGKWTTIALTHAVVVTPYVFVAVQASLAGLDPSLIKAVRSLGGGGLAVARYVYWPAVLPGVLGGAVFAFIGSFDEVIIAQFLSGPTVESLPVRMFNSLQQELTPKVAAVSALLFLLSLFALSAQVVQLRTKARRENKQ